MIPNIVHFMYFTGPNSRPFSYLNYLAVKAAFEIQKPDKIFFYYNINHDANPYWARTLRLVTPIQITPPTEIKGVSLNYPQYQADIVRLEKLYQYGGIYLDTDMLLIKSLERFMHSFCVLGGESYIGHQHNLNTTDIDKILSVSNALIMCEPKSRFIKDWLELVPEDMKKGIWAHHAVNLPLDMLKADPGYFDLQTVEKFVPFDFRNRYIFGNNYQDLAKLQDSYALHMWQTIWHDELSKINDHYLKTVDNLFTFFFRKFAE